ncbi:MAG: hypothetical protein EAX90_06400 [Candidatus Heimdallarchaeota archaeon]|nr:hypothetical protein [Candidatus Heimdallarchaeota archaeon]
MSIPAYIISKSWILIVGLFGFEGCILAYYWYKNKSNPQIEDHEDELILSINQPVTNQLPFNSDIFNQEIADSEETDEIDQEFIISEFDRENTSGESILPLNPNSSSRNVFSAELSGAEKEFDLLWEEAIKHVSTANSNNKKKAGEQHELTDEDSIQTELPSEYTTKIEKKINDKMDPKKSFHESSAIINSNKKEKNFSFENNPSIIQSQHKELFNEIALNNWIYAKSADRDRVGIFKIALDESRFREKDIRYLIENGILHKLLIPFHNGAFCIYSIYEGEDKKLMKNYITNLCKKKQVKINQKTIAIINYQELGLEKKNWRLDLQIGEDILGLIWISNFLINDEMTNSYAISYQKKKELKALFAATQLKIGVNENTALILTDYNESVQLINNYIKSTGYGKASVLAVGENNFEKEFLKIIQSNILI